MTASSRTRPEPAWWTEARDLRATGLSQDSVAYLLGKSVSSVRYALNPSYRALRLKIAARTISNNRERHNECCRRYRAAKRAAREAAQ